MSGQGNAALESDGGPRALPRELLVVLAFAALTILMTWPWAARLRQGVPDRGDPYLNAWILWWDFHQTFRSPLDLFQAPIFFPSRYALAFSEHNFGIALPLFPLFAAGLRPLTVHNAAMLLGFAFSGYGAYRLGRTLTGSTGAGLVTGVAFAFVPYRFHQLSHLNYVFAGWIPLLFEALVLFVRKRSRGRAAWLGAAFLMNGLTCVHWLVLTSIPFALAAALLALREGVERERDFLRRGGAALAAAGLLLLPFLVPYQRAAALYGFTRSALETTEYSAHLRSWLSVHPGNRFWHGLGEPVQWELALFPGLVPILLAAAGLLLARPERETAPGGPRRKAPAALLRTLDAVALVAGTIALLASTPSGIDLRRGDTILLQARDPSRALFLLTAALLVRCSLAWPFGWWRGRNLPESLRLSRLPVAHSLGLVLLVTGFLGSFGMNGPFHRMLYEVVPLFRSIRVPARWAMVADLGLALLAGFGAFLLARRLERIRRGFGAALFAALVLLLLVEQRNAPLLLEEGRADPDEATRFLAATPMRGGVVDLPIDSSGPYEAMLRAADHHRPLVTAVSGFATPDVERLRELTEKRPLPPDLLDLLESIPASYVVVHVSRIPAADRAAWRAFLDGGVVSSRLRFAGRFDGDPGTEIFAVTRTEPAARAAAPQGLEEGSQRKRRGG